MNITSGINNIKLKKFNVKDKKNNIKSKESLKKQKNIKETKISTLFPNLNKTKHFGQNKTPDISSHVNPNLTHHSFYNQENNKMLSKILLPEKRDKINYNYAFKKNDNNYSEKKIYSDIRHKTSNTNINNNYIKDNRNKKIKQISLIKNSEIPQINFQSKNKTVNSSNSKINIKIPEDNMRNKIERINISKKNFEVKKNNNENIKKFTINDYIKKENENYSKTLNNININDNSIRNENNKIIFNNVVKKTVIETKTSGSNFKPSLSDDEI